jgi:hypothetical protein
MSAEEGLKGPTGQDSDLLLKIWGGVEQTQAKVELLQEDVQDTKLRMRDLSNHMMAVATRQASIESLCQARSASYDRHRAVTEQMLTDTRREVAQVKQVANGAEHTGQMQIVQVGTIWRVLGIVGACVTSGFGVWLISYLLKR